MSSLKIKRIEARMYLETMARLMGTKGQQYDLQNKFGYAVLYNKRHFESEVKTWSGKNKSPETPEYEAYETERKALCVQHANKLPNGEPKTIVEENVLRYDLKPESQIKNAETGKTVFDEALEEIQSRHPEAMKQQEEKLNNWNNFLEEEIEIEIRTISKEYLPGGLSAAQLDVLDFMVEKESEKEPGKTLSIVR